MDREDILEIGAELGAQAVERVSAYAGEVCEYERRRIELGNQARISQLQMEGTELTRQKRGLEERIRLAPQPHAVQSQKRRILYYWSTGVLLVFAAFFFSLLSFDPYRLGWKGILYCVGVGLVTPFAVEVFLEAWKSERILKALVSVVFVAALAGGMFLAAIRGDLLAHEVKESAPAVVIGGESAPAPQPQDSFYESTHASLRLLMILLAFAIDLGAGIAIHRALLLGAAVGENSEKLAVELGIVNARIEAIVFEITALTNAPSSFEARFWRDFYRAMLTQTARKAMTKFMALILGILFLGLHPAQAGQKRLNLVVAVDLSASVAAKGEDGKSDFEKNLVAVNALLTTVPAGAQVTVIGITGNSFGEPYILLKAEVDDDPGYFSERLAAARRSLVSAWQKQTQQLKPASKHTDILGAFMVAGQLFAETPDRRKMLIIFSDMRQETRELDLESRFVIQTSTALGETERQGLFADLRGVEVTVLGADGAGRTIKYWESLKQFWAAYFQKTGAALVGFSSLRTTSPLDSR